jgi:hypothetical protein
MNFEIIAYARLNRDYHPILILIVFLLVTLLCYLFLNSIIHLTPLFDCLFNCYKIKVKQTYDY